jgi:hypothetical protein
MTLEYPALCANQSTSADQLTDRARSTQLAVTMLGQEPVHSCRVGLELVCEDVIMRVDDDIFEVFTAKYFRRTPLRWLVVRAEPLRNNRVQITVGQKNFDQIVENVDLPLYAWESSLAPTNISSLASTPTTNRHFVRSSQKFRSYAVGRLRRHSDA